MYHAVFQGVDRVEQLSHSHVEKSMAYVNKLADKQSMEAMAVLDKLRDADEYIKEGDTEADRMLGFAHEYAFADKAWRKEVVKAFTELAKARGKNSADIIARIQALDKDIMLDVGKEEEADEKEIQAEEEKSQESVDEQKHSVEGTIDNLRSEEGTANKEESAHIDAVGSGVEGEFSNAKDGTKDLEKQLNSINEKMETIGEKVDDVNAKEQAVQDSQAEAVHHKRDKLNSKLHEFAQGVADGSSGESLLEIEGKIDGAKVLELLDAGVSEEAIGSMLSARHKHNLELLHAKARER